MIPASILLIMLVLADVVSHITLWLRERRHAAQLAGFAATAAAMEEALREVRRG